MESKRTFNADYLVSVTMTKNKKYMQCDTKSEILACEQQGLIIKDGIAYYKPTVSVQLVSDTCAQSFDNVDAATLFYEKIKAKIKNQFEF